MVVAPEESGANGTLGAKHTDGKDHVFVMRAVDTVGTRFVGEVGVCSRCRLGGGGLSRETI